MSTSSALGLWAATTLVLTVLLGGCGFVGVFRGFDADHPHPPDYTAGWLMIAATITLTVGTAVWLRRRAVILAAIASVPLQVWFYAAYAIPAAQSIPNA